MLTTFILSSVVLAIFIAPAEQYGSTTTILPLFHQYDISEFVGTPLPIWTYQSTSPGNSTCQVDVMVNMSRYHILFNRSKYEGEMSRRRIDFMDGNFTGFPIDTMAVGGLGMLAMQSEKIMYESQDYECAVIKVSLTGSETPWYDLRVRNSSVTQGPSSECTNQFKQYASNGTKRYLDSCQEILRPENRRRGSWRVPLGMA
uniref:Putative lipocalin-3 1 n=1 Tax=Amblyomma parvum TaxID=251391 RepID=A0A023G150_AMBPA